MLRVREGRTLSWCGERFGPGDTLRMYRGVADPYVRAGIVAVVGPARDNPPVENWLNA